MDVADTGEDLVMTVRDGDYARFLAIQLAPSQKRAALYAITALSIEVARVAEIVSEALIGHIRLAWWREALEEIEAGKPPRKHPLVQALAQVHAEYPRLFPFLYEMIEARAADLDTSLIAQETAWRDYCNHTAGALHMAMAMVLDEPCARAFEGVIREQGMAYAMVGLVRAIPFMASRGWQRIPQTRLDAHHIVSLQPSAELTAMCCEILNTTTPILNSPIVNPRLKMMRALGDAAMLAMQGLLRVSGDPYRETPAKLRLVWRMMRLKYAPATCF